MESTDMTNPIPHSSLFATPEDLYSLDLAIKQLSSSEQAIAYHYTMLAFNLAHKMIEQQQPLRQHTVGA
jgi:hypothetical protein